MEKREQRAEVLIALLFVLLGGLTCLIALIVLYEKESPDDVIAGALRIASPTHPPGRPLVSGVPPHLISWASRSLVIIVAAVSIVVLAVLAVAKFRLATALHSQAFRQDAWVTTISCVLSVGLLVSLPTPIICPSCGTSPGLTVSAVLVLSGTQAGSVIYHIDNDIWFIDCLVALPLGGALLIYGLKTLCTRQWWQPHFWGYYQTNASIN